MTALQGWLLVTAVWVLVALVAGELYDLDQVVARAARSMRARWRQARVGRWLAYRSRLRSARSLVAQLEARRESLRLDREALAEPLEFADVGSALAHSLATATQSFRELGTDVALPRAQSDLASLERQPVRLFGRS